MFNLFKVKKNTIISPCDGHYIQQENINDNMFSKGIIGQAFAIKPVDNNIFSPISGEITMIYPTKHAIGIRGQNDMEMICHIGVDSVNLKGEGFELHIVENQKIKQGDLIATVDFDLLKRKGYFDDVICVFTKVNKLNLINTCNTVKKGEYLGEYQ